MTLALLILTAVAGLIGERLTRRDRPPPPPPDVAVPRLDRPATPTPIDAPPLTGFEEGVDQFGTIHTPRLLHGTSHDRLAGFLNVGGQWAVAEIDASRVTGTPPHDGALVRFRGREVPYGGRPVLLPNGMRARTCLELSVLETVDTPR